MTQKSQRKFSNIFVKKKLQLKFVAVIGFLMATMMLTLWLANTWGVSFVIGADRTRDVVFLGYMHQIKTITLMAGLFVLGVNFIFVIGITHYFAGPVYRFERVFEQMEKGDLSMTVHLRKHDELQDTAVALNRAILGLRTKFGVQS